MSSFSFKLSIKINFDIFVHPIDVHASASHTFRDKFLFGILSLVIHIYGLNDTPNKVILKGNTHNIGNDNDARQTGF